ncbi:transmembrane protein, putative (macronuclear) [Tetrahymena thermophila SB210]|uniref:Transmembrane protein, putative n=1 Tax=Tetrahymena thermophila (strain SB210) TaxID=312017 RepID=I7M0U6_TETTS|nr:transmembrane protein, putative [Tetrahymena thermophila SB210]EAR90965.2 transmembrane protein, putative [Tetrahymena thermophila SB210]|eukprot:XP_001011210.2 transmembrane protein, putative [Tetrahymena thermophila SB210]
MLQQQDGQNSRNTTECSCKDLSQILKNIDNNQAFEVRKKLIHLYLNENYLDSKLKFSENICSTFYFLAYQVEISESPMNALILLIEYEMIHQKKLSLHYQMILADLKMKAQIRFDNQQKLRNILKSNLLDGIKYDFLLQNIDQNLFKCLNQLKYINNYLSNDFIDLYNLHQKSARLVHDIEELEKYFLYVYQINPNSSQLQYYLNAYTHIFDLRICNIQNIIKSQQLFNVMQFSELDLNICDQRNCILFVSLLQQIGQVKLVTRNSEKIIGKPPSELVHQSINLIIPSFIAKFHDQIIKNVIKNGFLLGSKDANFKEQNRYQFFAKDSKNYIFPIVLQLKLQIFGKCKDFGVSAIIQRVNNQSNQYILIDQKYSLRGKTFTIQNITKTLYKICFKQVLGDNQSKLQGLDINKLIPLMEVLNQEDKDRNKIGTIMLYPKTANHCNIFKKNNKMLKNGKDIGWFFMFALASNCGILDIDINLKIRKTQIGEIYKEIEITRIKKIYKPGERLTSMSTLKQQLSSKMGVSIFIGGAQLKKTFEIIEQGEQGQHSQSSFRKFQRLAKETKLMDSKEGSQQNFIVNKSLLPNKTKIHEDEYQTTSSDEKFEIEDPIQFLMKSNPSIKDAQTFNSSSRLSFQNNKKVEFYLDKEKRNSNQYQKNDQSQQYDKKVSLNSHQNQFSLNKFETANSQKSDKFQSKDQIQEIDSKESFDEQVSIKSQKPADMRKTLINNSLRLIQQFSCLDNQEQQLSNFHQENFKESDQQSETFRKNQSFNYCSHSFIANSKRHTHHDLELEEQINSLSLKKQISNATQENLQQLNQINDEVDVQPLNLNNKKFNQQQENSSKQKQNQETLQEIKQPTVTVINDDFQVIESTKFQSRGELDRIQTFNPENNSKLNNNQNQFIQDSDRILTFQTRADDEKQKSKSMKQLNKQEIQIDKNKSNKMNSVSIQNTEQNQDKQRVTNSSLSSIQKIQLNSDNKNVLQQANYTEELSSPFKNNQVQEYSERIMSYQTVSDNQTQISGHQIDKNISEIGSQFKIQQNKFNSNRNISELNNEIQNIEFNKKDSNFIEKEQIEHNQNKDTLHKLQSSNSDDDDSSSQESISNEEQQAEFREDSIIQTFNVLDYIQYKEGLQNKNQNLNIFQNISALEKNIQNQSQENLNHQQSEAQKQEQIKSSEQIQSNSKMSVKTESNKTLNKEEYAQEQHKIQQDYEKEQANNSKQPSISSFKQIQQKKRSFKSIQTFNPDIDNERDKSESHLINDIQSEIQYHKTIDQFKTYDAIDSQYIKSNTRKLSSDTQSNFQFNQNQQNNRFSLLSQNVQNHEKIIKLQQVQMEQIDKIEEIQIQSEQLDKSNQISSENNITQQSNEISNNKLDNSENLDDHYDEKENQEIEEELNEHVKTFYQENSYHEAGSQTDTFKEKDNDLKSSKVSQKKFITKEQDKIRKQSIRMLFQVQKKNYVLPKKNMDITNPDLNTEDAKSYDQDSAQIDVNEVSHENLDEDINKNVRILSNINSQENNNDLENRRRSLLHEHEDNFLNQGLDTYNRKQNKISKFIFQKNITVSQNISKIGYLAFFLLFFFTLFVFFSLLVQQQSIQDIIPYLSFGPNILYELSQVIMLKEFQYLSQYMNPSNQQIYDQNTLTNRTQTQLNQFRETLNNAEIIQSQNLPSQSILNLKIDYFDEISQETPQSGNIISVFEHLYLILWQYTNQINGLEPLKITHLNSQLLLNNTQQITNYFYNWTLSQLDQTNIYLQIGTYSIMAISGLIIFVIVPIYARLQLLKEKIMQQFATFSCELINKRNMQIDEMLIVLRKVS